MGNSDILLLLFRVVAMGLSLSGMYLLASELTKDKWICVAVAVMYATTPYLHYLLHVQGDERRGLLYGTFSWAVCSVVRLDKYFKVKEFLIAGGCIAVCLYADVVVGSLLCGLGMLYLIMTKKYRNISVFALGMLIAGPQLMKLAMALLTGVWNGEMIPIVSVMPTGYTVGRFFSHYYIVEPMPGLGISFIAVLALVAWLTVLEGRLPWRKEYSCVLMLVGMSMLLSLERFPWDMVQRVHPLFLRLVSLLKELNLFVGIMNMGLAVLAIPIFEEIKRKEKEKQTIS